MSAVVVRSVYFIIIVIYLKWSCAGKLTNQKTSGKVVYFRTAETTFNPTHLTHYTLSIYPDNKSADIYAGVSHNYTADAWIFLTITLRTQRSNREIPMFQYDFNMCNVLPKMGKSMRGFIVSWTKKFWSQSNMPQACPFLTGNYSWIGLNMEQLNIPSFLPTSKYDVRVFTYFRLNNSREMLTNSNLLVEVK